MSLRKLPTPSMKAALRIEEDAVDADSVWTEAEDEFVADDANLNADELVMDRLPRCMAVGAGRWAPHVMDRQ